MKHDPKGAATCKSVQGATRLTAVADPPQVRGPSAPKKRRTEDGSLPRFCAQCTRAAAKCDGFRDIYNAIKPQFTLLQNNSARLGILGLGLVLVEWRARAH
eukprot:scaffold135144_cov61-Phaeocystis_antarctica.AAC.1